MKPLGLCLALLLLGTLLSPLTSASQRNAYALRLAGLLVAGDPCQVVTEHAEALVLVPDAGAERLALRRAALHASCGLPVGLPDSRHASHGPIAGLWRAVAVLGRDRAGAVDLLRGVPNSALYWAYRGDRAYAAGNHDQALADYRLSLELDGDLAATRRAMASNLCDHHLREGPSEAAVEWCELAVDVARSPWSLADLGRAYYAAGEYQQAAAVLIEARDMAPDAPGIYYHLAVTRQRMGDLSLAMAAYRQGLSLDPRHQYLNFGVAELYERLGRPEEAYCHYEQVLQFGSNARLVERAEERLATLDLLPPPECPNN